MTVKVISKKGTKSPNDRIYIIDIDGKRCAFSFRMIAYLVALLIKNEQVITNEIEYYREGGNRFKRYLDRVFEKNWVIVPNENIQEELNKIYYSEFKRQK